MNLLQLLKRELVQLLIKLLDLLLEDEVLCLETGWGDWRYLECLL